VTAAAASAAPSAAPAPPAPGSLLLLWVARGELLESDKAGLRQLEVWLKDGGAVVSARAADAVETAALEVGAAAPAQPLPLPPSVLGFETVVALTLEAPKGTAPNRTSGGRSRLFVLHPPSPLAVLSVVHDAGGSTYLGAEYLARRLRRHLTLRSAELRAEAKP
jgi:hypothetical protein